PRTGGARQPMAEARRGNRRIAATRLLDIAATMVRRRRRALATILGMASLVAGVQTASASAAGWQPGPEKYGVGQRQNVPVTMADGTVLRADVYFPTNPQTGAAAGGSFPVILTQTPYGKGSSGASFPGGDQLAGLSGFNPYL